MKMHGVLAFLLFAATALADVDLRWEPRSMVANVNQTVTLSIWAQADNEPISRVDFVVTNDAELNFMGVISTAPADWDYAGYPTGLDDPDGYNRDKRDGIIYYSLRAPPDALPIVPPEGLRLLVLQFRVVAQPAATTSTIGLQEYGGVVGTAVYDADGEPVTGMVAGGHLAIGAGSIVLEWRPTLVDARPGERFEVGMYAVSGDGVDQPFTVADLVLQWDPGALRFVRLVNTGPYEWFYWAFEDDSIHDGFNNSFDDGDAWLTLWSRWWHENFAVATPEGLLLATFEFQVRGGPGETSVGLLWWGLTFNISAIYNDVSPGGLSIMSSAGTATINVEMPAYVDFAPCLTSPGREAPLGCECMDFDGDGDVDLADFAVLQRTSVGEQ